jgi:hypothetical protein
MPQATEFSHFVAFGPRTLVMTDRRHSQGSPGTTGVPHRPKALHNGAQSKGNASLASGACRPGLRCLATSWHPIAMLSR